jgi:hypothetical protein
MKPIKEALTDAAVFAYAAVMIPYVYTAWFIASRIGAIHQYLHRNDPPPPPDPRWPAQPTFQHKTQTHFTVEDP